MLDLRALVDGTGSTTEATLSTIPNGDGQTVAGVPIDASGKPTLAMLSVDELVAGTPIKTIRMFSTDLDDNQAGFDLGVSFPPDFVVAKPFLQYEVGAVQPKYSQTVAARINAGLLWHYRGKGPTTKPARAPRRMMAYTTTFSGALTAGAWGSQAFSPTSIPNGRYAILGARVSSITKRALLRFSHPDFGQYKPGFPITQADLAATVNELLAPDELLQHGHQFEALSDFLGTNECPVFTVKTNGTGLNIEILSNTADTPKVDLLLHKVG